MTKTLQGRLEDDRFLKGQGRFVEDLPAEGCLHGVFVRSPHAHARIGAVDTAAAAAAPGVAAVLTGADLAAAGVKPMRTPMPMNSFDGTPFVEPDRHALAIGRVRFAGEAVALVLADTAEQAADAGELIMIDYEEEPPQTDPALSDEVAFTWKLGDEAATRAVMAGAAHRVTIREINNRVVAAPIEARSAIGSYDGANKTYLLQTQTQGVHFMRGLVAASLDIEPGKLRVVTPDVGGSFGMKLVAYPEQVAVLAAARLTGRTVRWVATRGESMLADAHARDHVSEATLALDADGRFLGLELLTHGNLGAYCSAFATLTISTGFAKTIGSVYRIGILGATVRGVYTNTAPTDAYRGAGKPESVLLMERLVDKAARETGIDRMELRRRNLAGPAEMPCTAATGMVWKDADFPQILERTLAASDWPGFAARRAQSAAAGRLRGFGLGMYLHISGGVPEDTASVTLEPDGIVAIRTGAQDIGQGLETSFAGIVAGKLGIDADQIRVRLGDSEDMPARTTATGGSSALQIAGINIFHATDDMIEKLRPRAGEAMEAASADIEYGAGKFTVRGTDISIALADLARRMPPAELNGCAGSADFSGNHVSVPNGAYACELEVDPDTGQVEILAFTGTDDAGTRLNPAIVEGQLHGGIAQGIGAALLERVHYDESGQLLTGSWMDYAMPRAGDIPAFSLHDAAIPNSHNPLGAKGVGEPGTIGAPAAVMNAVVDAIGVQNIMMPATPERVWRAIREDRAQ
ncbi:MAG: xanthine dehydrogenase family protein molybdopterin-binding subunit [Alphaproteobacteria bacterium]|nr:xanthine dehydrogenase family protein molybdopterin-binding subunit [Alphaproteobacteria bacterium]